MGFAWSHTTYAKWHGIIFNFEWKRDLEYFLVHAEESERIYAVEAYTEMFKHNAEFVKIEASCRQGSNENRKKEIKAWYANRKCTIQC